MQLQRKEEKAGLQEATIINKPGTAPQVRRLAFCRSPDLVNVDLQSSVLLLLLLLMMMMMTTTTTDAIKYVYCDNYHASR